MISNRGAMVRTISKQIFEKDDKGNYLYSVWKGSNNNTNYSFFDANFYRFGIYWKGTY